MKQVLFASVGLLVGTSVVSAADLKPTYKAPPAAVVAQAYNWNGFYIGGNVGYSAGRLQNDVLLLGVNVATDRQDLDGIVGGMQVGANWQVGHRFVVGVEIDAQGTGQRGNVRYTFGAIPAAVLNLDARHDLPWFGTARGRLGFLVTDSALLYATGGAAFGRIETNYTLNVVGVPLLSLDINNDKVGWTVGGGVEWKFAQNWSAKAEYLYVDFGRENIQLAVVGVPFLEVRNHVYDHIGRFGINYHFWTGGGGPVLASY
jgi:outer membrane immunogenic protein